MKKFIRKGKKFIVLATVLSLVASPVLFSKYPTSSVQSLSGDIWLIGDW